MVKLFTRINLLGIILICLSQNVAAQNYFDGTSYTITLDHNKLDYGGIEFSNEKSYPLILSWKKLLEDTVSGSRFDMCANSECYITVPDSGSNSNYPVLPNDTGFFKLHYWTGAHSGTSTIKLYVFEQAFPNDGDTLTYTLNISSISTNVVEKKSLQPFNVYPIPSDRYITIESNYQRAKDAYMVHLVDAFGRRVFSKSIDRLKFNRLDIANIESGVYMLQMVNEESQIIYTNKIIVNHN